MPVAPQEYIFSDNTTLSNFVQDLHTDVEAKAEEAGIKIRQGADYCISQPQTMPPTNKLILTFGDHITSISPQYIKVTESFNLLALSYGAQQPKGQKTLTV